MDQSDRPLEVMVESGTYVKEKSLNRLAVNWDKPGPQFQHRQHTRLGLSFYGKTVY